MFLNNFRVDFKSGHKILSEPFFTLKMPVRRHKYHNLDITYRTLKILEQYRIFVPILDKHDLEKLIITRSLSKFQNFWQLKNNF